MILTVFNTYSAFRAAVRDLGARTVVWTLGSGGDFLSFATDDGGSVVAQFADPAGVPVSFSGDFPHAVYADGLNVF